MSVRIKAERLDRALEGYALYVSTIGEIHYRPEEWRWARGDFYFYAESARDGSGKAAGAEVVLHRDGKVIARWPPEVEKLVDMQRANAAIDTLGAMFGTRL